MACTLARDVALTDRVRDAGPRVFQHPKALFVVARCLSDGSQHGQQSLDRMQGFFPLTRARRETSLKAGLVVCCSRSMFRFPVHQMVPIAKPRALLACFALLIGFATFLAH